MSVEAVLAAINKTGVAEVVRHSDGDTKLHITHRVSAKRLSIWVAILNYVLSRKNGWEVHACKQYFYSEGKVRYAWNFIIQWGSVDLKDGVLHQIATLFLQAAKQVPSISYSLDSYPLPGAKEGRNMPEGGFNPRSSGYRQRGAHKIGGQNP